MDKSLSTMEEVCPKRSSTTVPMSPTLRAVPLKSPSLATVKVTPKTHKSQFCPLPDGASVHERERSIEQYIL